MLQIGTPRVSKGNTGTKPQDMSGMTLRLNKTGVISAHQGLIAWHQCHGVWVAGNTKSNGIGSRALILLWVTIFSSAK